MSAEQKIENLIEETLSTKAKKRLKAAGIAALGGVAGAGLDLYLNGGKNVDDYIKPVLAWGTGGALSGVLQDTEDKEEAKESKETKKTKGK